MRDLVDAKDTQYCLCIFVARDPIFLCISNRIAISHVQYANSCVKCT